MGSKRETDGHFGYMLDKYRIERGLTKTQLADKMGCSNHAVGKWIAGEREPRPTDVRKYAKNLGVKPSYFVNDEEGETEPK